ncbi:MAG: GAF domain-containing protein [Anaerolineae bacterium]
MAASDSTEASAPRAFPHFTGRLRRLARAAWWLVLAVVVVMTIIAVPLNVRLANTPCPLPSCADPRLTADQLRSLASGGISHEGYVLYILAYNLVPPLVFIGVALVLFLRKPDDGMAYFTALTLVLFGGVSFPDFLQQLAVNLPVWAAPFVALKYVGSVCIIAFFLLFPTGRVEPRWMRYVLALDIVEELVENTAMPPVGILLVPEAVLNVSILIVPLAALYAQIYRYRNVSTPKERRQTRWVVAGVSVALSVFVLSAVAFFSGVVDRTSMPQLLLMSTLVGASITLIPISIGIAILRSHLYDIDLLINRTVLYGAVTAILAGLLAVSSDLTKRVFLALTGQRSDVAPMIATLTVVAAFDPVRKRVSRLVDAHFKYPTRSFGSFEERVQEHIELADPAVLAECFLVQAVATYEARSGAIYLGHGRDVAPVIRLGDEDAHPVLTVPLAHAGHAHGRIDLGARVDGGGYDDADRAGLKAMAELVAHAIHVSAGRR